MSQPLFQPDARLQIRPDLARAQLQGRYCGNLHVRGACVLAMVALAGLTRAGAAESASPAVPDNYHLVYQQTFAKAASLHEFAFSDPGAWRWTSNNDITALELARQSKYNPPVRSPFNIALIADEQFGDFVLEADLIQTGKEYGHRDMCLFFGVQSPTNFYYAHIATAADEHAHNIFIVDGAPRIKMARQTTAGVNWGLGVWHRVRLERRLADGAVKVYFDNLTQPIMVAEDRRLGAGHLGFGSFDDTGMIRNIRIWAPKSEKKTVPFFTRVEEAKR